MPPAFIHLPLVPTRLSRVLSLGLSGRCRARLSALALGAACLLLPGAATAQETPIELPGLRVEDSRPEILRASQALAEIPGGTGLVDAAALRIGRLNTPADLFQLQPGVLVLTAFGGIDHPRLSIRGASIQRGGDPGGGRGILFLQDGFPVNFSDGSFDFVEFLDPAMLDHASIFRGGNAFTLGSTTLGGAVNLVSPTGIDGPRLARVEAGAHDYFRAQLSHSSTDGPRDVFLTMTGFSLGGWRDYNHQEAARAALNFGWRFPNGWTNRVHLSAMRSRVEITGVQTLEAIAAGSTAANEFTQRSGTGRDTAQYRLGDRLTRQFANNSTLSLGAYLAYVTYDFTQGPNITFANNIDGGVDASWTMRGELLSLPNTLTLGLRAQLGRRDQRVHLNGPGRPPAIATREVGLMHSHNRLVAENATLWLDHQLALGRGFTLVTALSAARANRNNDERYAALRTARPDSSGGAGSAALLPRLGVRYERKNFQWFANVTRNWEPLTWDALLTTHLGAGDFINGPDPRRAVPTQYSAQHGITAETGARGTAGPLMYEITGYRTWLRNELLSLATDAAGMPTQFGNADRTIHQGVETSVSLDLLRLAAPHADARGHALLLRAAHTWSDFSFDSDPLWGNNDLPVMPPHLLQAALQYRHASGWHGGVTLTWQPRGGWADYANTQRAPGYTIVGLSAGYAPKKGAGFFLDLRNLFDRSYVSGINSGIGNFSAPAADKARFFAGEPLSLYGGVEWKW
ncbi:MAG: TonB-dependent receptor [Opitutaceae bacterium]|jgi:iron complex outermembrane receptor protein|nr:TonB-dependent receptor [Opitutaceae bacterium]